MKKTALLLAVVLLLGIGLYAADKGSWTGWVSDEKCGTKGTSASHADCAKKCIEGGAKAVLVTDKDHQVMNISNQDAVKDHAGQHVKVTGTNDNGTLTVDKVTPAGGKAKSKGAKAS